MSDKNPEDVRNRLLHIYFYRAIDFQVLEVSLTQYGDANVEVFLGQGGPGDANFEVFLGQGGPRAPLISDLLNITLKFRWTRLQLAMRMKPGEYAARNLKEGESVLYEVAVMKFNTTAMPIFCYMKISKDTTGNSLQLHELKTGDFELSFDKENIRYNPWTPSEPEAANALKDAAYRTGLSREVDIKKLLENYSKSYLENHVFKNFAVTETVTI